MRTCMPCPYLIFEIVALNQIFIGISIDLSFIQSHFFAFYNKHFVKCVFIQNSLNTSVVSKLHFDNLLCKFCGIINFTFCLARYSISVTNEWVKIATLPVITFCREMKN